MSKWTSKHIIFQILDFYRNFHTILPFNTRINIHRTKSNSRMKHSITIDGIQDYRTIFKQTTNEEN